MSLPPFKDDLPILVVEDSDADFEAMSRLFNSSHFANPVFRCSNGDDALDFLFHRGRFQNEAQAPRPGMIFLDLNLPGTDGFGVLSQIKASPELRSIPVLVISGSAHPDDIQLAYYVGASTYLSKPADVKEFGPMIEVVREYWLGNKFLYLT